MNPWECWSLWWNISISVICQCRRRSHSRILRDCAISSGSPSTIITVENNTLTCSTSGYPLPTVLLYTCPGTQDTYVPTSAFLTDGISSRLHMMLEQNVLLDLAPFKMKMISKGENLMAPSGWLLCSPQGPPFYAFAMSQKALAYHSSCCFNSTTTIIMILIIIITIIWFLSALSHLQVWKCFHLSGVPRWYDLTVERGGRASAEVSPTVSCWWCHCGMCSFQSRGHVPSNL